jgi:hypothetical protein
VVEATAPWQGTGLLARSGDRVDISVVGGSWTWHEGVVPSTDGEGAPDSQGATLPSAPHGALLARIGSGEGGTLFVVGNDSSLVADRQGVIYLQMNDGDLGDNSGSLTVLVRVEPGT